MCSIHSGLWCWDATTQVASDDAPSQRRSSRGVLSVSFKVRTCQVRVTLPCKSLRGVCVPKRTTIYLTCLHSLQASDRQMEISVRFPSSIAFISAVNRPICTISKVSSLHFYTWADFSTTEYLICLRRVQECDRHADTWF